jgi:hypothetical protein
MTKKTFLSPASTYCSTRDWISNEVYSWFSADGNDDEYGSRRQRRQSSNRNNNDNVAWSPFNAFDAFLGVNRDQLQSKAELYDRQMGISSNTNRGNERRATPRRPGRAYRYGREEDDDYQNGDEFAYDIDAEPIIEDGRVESKTSSTTTPASSQDLSGDSYSQVKRRGLSWEEHALAVV